MIPSKSEIIDFLETNPVPFIAGSTKFLYMFDQDWVVSLINYEEIIEVEVAWLKHAIDNDIIEGFYFEDVNDLCFVMEYAIVFDYDHRYNEFISIINRIKYNSYELLEYLIDMEQQNVIDTVSSFIQNYQFTWDLSPYNFGFRPNGELVLFDPFTE